MFKNDNEKNSRVDIQKQFQDYDIFKLYSIYFAYFSNQIDE